MINSFCVQRRKANLCWCRRCQFSLLKFIIIANFIFAFDHLRRFQLISIANCQSSKNRFCCFLLKCFKIYNQSLCQFMLPTRNRKSIKLQSFPKRCNGEFDWRSKELEKFWFNSIKCGSAFQIHWAFFAWLLLLDPMVLYALNVKKFAIWSDHCAAQLSVQIQMLVYLLFEWRL